MSATLHRIPLTVALPAAIRIRSKIVDCCDRCEIVGSVRRGRPNIGDIELLAIPKMECVPNGLFGMTEASMLTPRLQYLVDSDVLRRENDGKTMLKFGIMDMVHDGQPFPLEINISTPERWGVEMIVKTGPAEFSKALVTPRQFGGMLPAGMRIASGWRLLRGDQLIDTPDERAVFAAIGVDFIPADARRWPLHSTDPLCTRRDGPVATRASG